MSAHVVMEGGALVDGSFGQVLDRPHECLAGHFDVEHSTLQLEPAVTPTTKAHGTAEKVKYPLLMAPISDMM